MSRPDDANVEADATRRALFGLAYRMLGTRADAEDAVHDAYLRWYACDREGVASPIAWLRTTLTRLCVDRLRAAKRRTTPSSSPTRSASLSS